MEDLSYTQDFDEYALPDFFFSDIGKNSSGFEGN